MPKAHTSSVGKKESPPKAARSLHCIAVDHHDPSLVESFCDTWREISEQAPLHWTSAHGGYWIATSYDAVSQITRDAERFSSDFTKGGNTIPAMPFEFGFVDMDPPDATLRRKLLVSRFAPSAARAWEARARDVVTAFIDRIIEAGRCEFIDDIAAPVPAVLTMEMIGLSIEHWKLCADANHHLNTAFPGSDLAAQATAEMGEVESLLKALIQACRAGRGGNRTLVALLCNARINGELLPDDQILNDLRLILNGGVDTSASLLGSALRWLSDNPDQRLRLRENVALLDSATEEFLRYFTPVTAMARTCVKDTTVAGHLIRANERVLMSFSSANADPDVFANPETVDLAKKNNRHTSFGAGPHRCLGSHFARTEFKVMLCEIVRRMPDFVIDTTQIRPYRASV